MIQPSPFVLASVGAMLLVACSQFPSSTTESTRRGQAVYAKECAACHGASGEGAGPAAAALPVTPPNLTLQAQGNQGVFPRTYVRHFVIGVDPARDPASPMPDFATTGLRHVYPDGGADGEVLEAAFEDMLDYLEAIQK